MSLAEKLICNSSVVFERNRYDDGTLEEPDVTIDNIWAEVVRVHGIDPRELRVLWICWDV